jgi:hypothetical protein
MIGGQPGGALCERIVAGRDDRGMHQADADYCDADRARSAMRWPLPVEPPR